MTVRVGVLGPVQIAGGDAGGAATRALLAALALAAGSSRSGTALADDLWGDSPPRNPRAALQTVVSRTRALGGADLIQSVPGGYALAPAETDLSRARRLLTAAGTGPAAERLEAAEAALALWRGEPGADLGDAPVAAELSHEAAVLAERLRLLRARALGAMGRTTQAVAELETMTDAHPLDEGLQLELLTALQADGRATEAIARYAGFADRLREDLGASPGRALRELNARLLRAQEPGPRVRVGMRAAPNPLIGREGDLSAIVEMLARGRLVTILGVGGLGKTRVAYEVANASDEESVIVIPLAAVRDDADVESAIATALGVGESAAGTGFADTLSRPDLRSRIMSALGERATLLVLDNCEQVVQGVAMWVADALAHVAGLRILATSRTPLAIGAERVYPLRSLDAEGDASAVRLFVERARAVRPGAELDAEVVARLCAHLDGLPLAIELAAARVRTMTPEQIEERLQNRFALLTTGERTAPARHRTLEAVIEWSWDLLDAEARQALSALSVLPGGFSARTAAEVLERDDADDIIDALVAQSLLVVVDDAESGIRFRMLETVREFGLARLVRDGRDRTAWDAALRWARSFHGRPGSTMVGRFAPMDVALFSRIRSEHENLVVVLRRALEQGSPRDVLEIAGVLVQSWVIRGAVGELTGFSSAILGALGRLRSDAADPDDLAQVLLPCGIVSLVADDPQRALRAVARVRLLRRRAGAGMSPQWRAVAELLEGVRALPLLPGIIQRLRDDDDTGVRLIGELALSHLAENEGETGEALAASRRAWELGERRGDLWFATLAASSAADLGGQTGDPAETLDWLQRARGGLEAFGAKESLRQQSWTRGSALLMLGRPEEAEPHFGHMVHGGERTQEGVEHASLGWLGLAEIARLRAEPGEAAARYRRALSLFAEHDQRASPWYLLTVSALVAAVSADRAVDEDAAQWAERLRVRFLAVRRLRPVFVDKPILGVVLTGWSAWALTEPSAREAGLQALVLGEAMGARQDVPSLRIADLLHRAEAVLGSGAVASARAAASALRMPERTAAGLEILSGQPR
ncbi:BTAD domain-containing putative transcriptional regulator [Microbacterium sp. ARD32]|uniref:ATP-binding protein n=1 Tax=Microbacterium sp. ARD32 TaxID=2962577 RepID=UPI00288248B0|nr:BTAD domain-containing putative transcriptional regulator [Microbacterium sp. ARD32]MDT0156942.1 BTAD domain-containing putative transcriptional regulator [Microbacterium sp. ARD32]